MYKCMTKNPKTLREFEKCERKKKAILIPFTKVNVINEKTFLITKSFIRICDSCKSFVGEGTNS